MDPIVIVVLSIYVIVTFSIELWQRYEKPKPKAITIKSSVDDWDEEFLRSEAKKHQLDKIEQCKVVFAFGKPGKPQDGMKWICICGANKGCVNLQIAEHSFKTHQNKMREITLAELGRFK